MKEFVEELFQDQTQDNTPIKSQTRYKEPMITKAEVIHFFKTMQINKSASPNGIPTEL